MYIDPKLDHLSKEFDMKKIINGSLPYTFNIPDIAKVSLYEDLVHLEYQLPENKSYLEGTIDDGYIPLDQQGPDISIDDFVMNDRSSKKCTYTWSSHDTHFEMSNNSSIEKWAESKLLSESKSPESVSDGSSDTSSSRVSRARESTFYYRSVY